MISPPQVPNRSRWMDWNPKPPIFPESPRVEPSKPTEPGFVGASFAEFPEIEADPHPAELGGASGVLNRAGCRIMALDAGTAIGVWSDLDGPEVREALRTFGSDGLPVRYMDGAGVPMRYKVRRVDGEPVAISVPLEMELNPAEPWKVRDGMLKEMGWCSKGTPWAEWKASLNRAVYGGGGRRSSPSRSRRIEVSRFVLAGQSQVPRTSGGSFVFAMAQS